MLGEQEGLAAAFEAKVRPGNFRAAASPLSVGKFGIAPVDPLNIEARIVRAQPIRTSQQRAHLALIDPLTEQVVITQSRARSDLRCKGFSRII